jgi:hypothetical protein
MFEKPTSQSRNSAAGRLEEKPKKSRSHLQEIRTPERRSWPRKRGLSLALNFLMTFGSLGMGGEIIYKKYEETRNYEEILRKKIEAVNNQGIEEIEARLNRMFGNFWSVGDVRYGQEVPEPITVSPIDTKDGKITENEIRSLLDHLPKGWVKGEINRLIQTDEEYSGPPPSTRSSKALAICFRYSAEPSEIFFYQSEARETSLGYSVTSIDHEVAHANDWLTDSQMSQKERLELLYLIAQRLSAPDRYKSGYVESIKEKTPEATNYRKAMEYWAEISKAYFNSPWNLSINDFVIVHNLVRKTDPDYNPYQTAIKRLVFKTNFYLNNLKRKFS